MKQIKLFGALLLLAVLLVGCEKYDDSKLSGRVDNLEERVDKLTQLVNDLNTNVTSLTKLVQAFQQENRIEKIVQVEGGYDIILADGKGTLPIRNGEKPSIGITLDEDGIYYWTVDGEFMLDNGNKIPATIAPEFKVEGGSFWFRVNGGEWAKVAGSDSGIGLIKDIVESEESVTFILSEGGEIVIPKVQAFRLNIDINEAGIMSGTSVSVPYTITSGDTDTKVAAIAGSGYTTSVSGNSQSGFITVTAPENVPAKADILVVAVNGKGVQSSKILTFEQGELKLAKDTYTVGAQGGEIQVELKTNLEWSAFIDPDPKNAWLTVIPATKALKDEVLTLSAAKYVDGTEPRTAEVDVRYGNTSQTITVTQLHTVVISGGSADFENFSTEPGRSMKLIEDETTGGWKLKNGYLRLPTAVTPSANSKFPALCGRIGDYTGVLTSPVLKGGCGILTVVLSGSKLSSWVPKGIKVNVDIKQNEEIVKSFSLAIAPEEYEQKQQFPRTQEVNISGEFQIVITNACPLQTEGTTSSNDDAFIPSIEWTGYSE